MREKRAPDRPLRWVFRGLFGLVFVYAFNLWWTPPLGWDVWRASNVPGDTIEILGIGRHSATVIFIQCVVQLPSGSREEEGGRRGLARSRNGVLELTIPSPMFSAVLPETLLKCTSAQAPALAMRTREDELLTPTSDRSQCPCRRSAAAAAVAGFVPTTISVSLLQGDAAEISALNLRSSAQDVSPSHGHGRRGHTRLVRTIPSLGYMACGSTAYP